jgi:hypothetical protein
VAAGDDERHERRLEAFLGQQVGEDVALEVVHADERDVQSHRHRLPRRIADEEGADQTGTPRRRHGVQVTHPHAGLMQGLLDDDRHLLDVCARRDLRNDAAELRMELGLGRDHVRQDLASAAQHRDRGFVARRFDAEDQSVPRDHWGDHCRHSATSTRILFRRRSYSGDQIPSAHMM